jgi:Na+-driven multidrug efflux pump
VVVVRSQSAVVRLSSQFEVNNEHSPIVSQEPTEQQELSHHGSKRRRFRNMIPGTRFISTAIDSDHGATKNNNTANNDIDHHNDVVNSKDRLALDRLILATAVPSMINMAVVPLVNAVDTFWVGRMGSALALAGQAAANHAFFTLYFLVSYLPTITAPRVAAAVGSGQLDVAQTRVSESLFLSNLLGGLGTVLLVAYPMAILSFILPAGTPAIAYAVPYLRYRALSMMPALLASTGFAAYRGLLDTVTPLKVSLCTK